MKSSGLVLVASLLFLPIEAMSQAIVVPDVDKFTRADCRWLHDQFLDECVSQIDCESARPEKHDFSMGTLRGLYSLESVITVRVMGAINVACYRACTEKKKPEYSAWQKTICQPLLKARR